MMIKERSNSIYSMHTIHMMFNNSWFYYSIYELEKIRERKTGGL